MISNEIRLIYIVDKSRKLPLYFRYVAGNIIDNSTLINTINMLLAHGIEIDIVIMDAGYSSTDNLSELLSANIRFITRMQKTEKNIRHLLWIQLIPAKIKEFHFS